MTVRRYRLVSLAAAAALAVTLAGCGLLDDDKAPDDAAPPAPSQPAPSGTSVYPVPAQPLPAPVLSPGVSGQPEGGIPSPSSVDQMDASAVSRGALTALHTYDTTLDASRDDAGRRTAAAGWCTAAYASELGAAASHAVPGAQWAEWAQHRAYTKVTMQQTEDAGRPVDSPTTAYRQWTVTATPTGRDGWTGPPEVHTVYAELTRPTPGEPWRLNSTRIQ